MGKVWLALGLALASSQAQDKPAYTFGTTVVDSGGLQGRVYHLKPGTQMLPNFGHMRPVGSIYTTSLNVWPQNFDEGFPSITDRFEWFADRNRGTDGPFTPSSDVLIDENRVSVGVHCDEAGRSSRALICLARKLNTLRPEPALKFADVGESG